jgi:hypothetical protein
MATELFFQGKSRAPHGAPFAKLKNKPMIPSIERMNIFFLAAI